MCDFTYKIKVITLIYLQAKKPTCYQKNLKRDFQAKDEYYPKTLF